MVAVAKTPAPASARGDQTTLVLSSIVLILTVIVSAGGVFLPGLYRDPAWIIPQTQGQDLVTLFIVSPALLGALMNAGRGSRRAALIQVGLLGYILYTAIGAAFSYAMNPFYPLYILLFSVTLAAFVRAVSRIDLTHLPQRFTSAVPRGPVAAFLGLMALMLSALWLSRIIPAIAANPVPAEVETFKFVFALDLGVIVPGSVLGAVWLWVRSPLGFLLAGCMLIKAATMGLALLGMSWASVRAGLPAPIELVGTYIFIAVGGLGLSTWFFRTDRG